MTDLHILGLPRSGTSFAFSYFVLLLRHSGLRFVDLFEPSNPWLKIENSADGYRITGFNSSNLDTTLEERMQIYRSYDDQHRLIKHVFQKHCKPYIDLMMRGDDLSWIEIKRNTFERCLSWVISEQSGFWISHKQATIDDFKENLTQFTAPLHFVESFQEHMKLYTDYRSRMIDYGTCLGVIDYDSLVSDCAELRGAVLKHFDLPDIGIDPMKLKDLEHYSHLMPKKSLTLEEKKHIVSNWQQILDLVGDE